MPRTLSETISPERRAANTERKRRWREQNPEKLILNAEQKQAARIRTKTHIEKNRAAHNEYLRQWAAKRRREAGIPKRGPSKTTDPEAAKAKQRQWRLNNPEKLARYTANWKARNPTKIKAYVEANRLKTRERNRKLQREKRAKYGSEWYHLTHEQKQEWNAKNRQRYANDLHLSREYTKRRSHIRRVRIKGSTGHYMSSDIDALFTRQKGKCACCTNKLVKEGPGIFHIDHIMPIVRGGSNWPDNLQLLCQFCNLSKGCKHPDDWAREHGLLFI